MIIERRGGNNALIKFNITTMVGKNNLLKTIKKCEIQCVGTDKFVEITYFLHFRHLGIN